MRYLIAVVAIYGCCIFTTLAQSNYAIKGSITDTASKTKIDGATITVLSAKDSILQKFTYTNKGAFNINNLKPGKFLLLVTYADYADYTTTFTLDAAHPVNDLKDISLIPKSQLLNEVIIKGRVVAMKLKGDTTEFDPKAYATRKNAKVEDLLKLLPGMRINQDGTIVFQGEVVNKVLVDGEEFFGDDPALVTKNIRVDMVKTLQVYNQKSEQAKMTGIDDGVKIKTINVQLLEDKKRGVFGKTDAGKSNDKYYGVQGMANKFTPKQKLSVYGNIGNTGNVGLGGGDNGNYGGRFTFYGYNGVGIPLARDGGAHYDTKWNKDKSSINLTYKLGSLTIDQVGNTITQNNLPGNYNKSNQDRTSNSYALRQAADVYFLQQLDSTSTLSAQITASTRYAKAITNTTTTTVRGNGVILNDNTNNTSGEGDFSILSSYLRYAKNLKKKGRNINIYSNNSFSEFTNDSYLQSTSNYYNALGVSGTPQVVDQYKPNISDSRSLSLGATYTEPLSKAISLSAGYSISQSTNNSNYQSFNKSAAGKYEVLDPLYSNNYSVVNAANTYNLSVSYHVGKLSGNAGGSLINSTLKQTDNVFDTVLTRNFVNWTANAYAFYQATKAATFSLSYSGNTTQPYITQIQPVRQNSDPLNITIGNAGLKPEFNNSLYFRYRVYQATEDRGINFNVSYGNTINAIVSNRVTDSAGVNTYQSSNLASHQPMRWSVYLEFYGHVPKVDFIIFPNISMSGNTYYNYINNQLNKTVSTSYKPAIDLRKNKTNYSYSAGVSVTFTKNATSLQQVNNNTKTYNADFSLYTKLPFNFYIGTDGNYEFTAKNQVFKQDFSKFILKAYFGKKFLKEETLKVAITGNDLLDQNTGYSRNGNTDAFTEQRNNVIRRYFLLSITWDFSKFGTLKKQ
jgi:hypothetical protein